MTQNQKWPKIKNDPKSKIAQEKEEKEEDNNDNNNNEQE